MPELLTEPRPGPEKALRLLLAGLTLVLLAGQVDTGNRAWNITPPPALITTVFLSWLAVKIAWAPIPWKEARLRAADLVIGFTMAGAPASATLSLQLLLTHYGLQLLLPSLASGSADAKGGPRAIQPFRLLASSFAALILLGTLLLTLPGATVEGRSLPVVDALFMATSAACVTGLSVLDVGQQLSRFGQIVILILIQVGGLGIMTLSAGSVFLLGRRVAMRDRQVMQEVLDSADLTELNRITTMVVKGTLLTEAVGAVLLTTGFLLRGRGLAESIWLGTFHAISAFCNAGFALFSDSLVGLNDDFLILSTVMALIVIGGIGFSVLTDLGDDPLHRRGSWSIHTRLVLATSGVLLAGGALFFFFSEGGASLQSQQPALRAMSASFMAVTARTAGFNTVPMAELSAAAVQMMLILMFIGASPGSTGGGIKTTTLAVMLLAIRQLASREQGALMGRSIPDSTLMRAFAITFISSGLIMLFTLLLCLTEQAPLQQIFFEVISAGATVGLSLGLTPDLTDTGRLLVTVLMFIGRIGPLSLALALGGMDRTALVRYPEARILVG